MHSPGNEAIVTMPLLLWHWLDILVGRKNAKVINDEPDYGPELLTSASNPHPASILFYPMGHYTVWHALIGGILIGLASLIATVLSGKVPGISGVFGRLLVPSTPDRTWRLVFLIGLISGAALSFFLWDSAALFRPMRPLGVTALAGLLVGFGTRLGGGCTSGHGVCGVGTAQKDSIAATFIFVTVAMLTVFIYNHTIS